jgi:hypothetical protein
MGIVDPIPKTTKNILRDFAKVLDHAKPRQRTSSAVERSHLNRSSNDPETGRKRS